MDCGSTAPSLQRPSPRWPTSPNTWALQTFGAHRRPKLRTGDRSGQDGGALVGVLDPLDLVGRALIALVQQQVHGALALADAHHARQAYVLGHLAAQDAGARLDVALSGQLAHPITHAHHTVGDAGRAAVHDERWHLGSPLGTQ